MKKARKLTAVLLSLVMLLALVVPASAAENYSITIQNNKEGHTYEAYQIFAGTVSSDEETNGETGGPMLGDITWGSGVNDASHAELLAALKADATIGALAGMPDAADAAAVAAALDGANAETAAAFADVVSDYLAAAPTGQTNTMADGNYIIQGLPAGYYLVKDQDESLEGDPATATEYIVQVLGNVQMAPKDSDIPTVEKKVSDEEYTQYEGAQGPDYQPPYGEGYNDVADWDIGDSVPFKLIGSIPDMSAYDTYKYIFTDTLSNGLTLQADTIKVYIARNPFDQVNNYKPLTLGAEYILNVQNVGENGGGSFSITFDDLKTNQYVAGEQGDEYHYVIVTYDATLNANAAIGLPGNRNSVDLQFSNDPNGEGLGRTAEDTVIVFTYELDGTKVDGANVNTKLEGAEFVLFNGGYTRVARVENGKLVGWLEPDVIKPGVAGTNDREKMNNLTNEDFAKANLTITSAENGTFKIAGLDDGTYFLREIQAPNGYNLLDHDLRIDIAATTTNGQDWNGVTDALTALTIAVDGGEAEGGNPGTGAVNVQVENNQGATLPETGGMGTTLFYIIGGLLVVGAGVLLVVRIRMKAHNE